MPQGVTARRDALQRAVITWAAANLRSFPWRDHSPTPYRVLIAELLLKRTTAVAAARLYDAFLRNYPTPAHLRSASERALAKDMEPVGLYTQRARSMVQLAQYLEEYEAGIVPSSLERLRKVPGLGDYSARAILSFGYGVPVAVVDSNVARIFQRLFRSEMPHRPSPGLLQGIADFLLPESEHRAFNFGLLDIGALVCRYTAPKCHDCPLIGICDFATGSGAGTAYGVDDHPAKGLRRARTAKGLSLAGLAQAAGLSKMTVINLEAGRTRPRSDTVRKLAIALGVSTDEVADGPLQR